MCPIRCVSCGKPIADKWEVFKNRLSAGESAAKILDDLGFVRYCCRRMILSQVDLVQELLPFGRF